MNACARSVTKQAVLKTHAQRKHAQCPAKLRLRQVVAGGGHQKLQVAARAAAAFGGMCIFEAFFGCYDPVSKSRQ